MRQVRVKKCMLFGLYSWPLEEKIEDHFKKLQGRVPKKLRKFGHMSKLGVPYLPRCLVWTKKSLGKYSYCLPYLPIQKVSTFLN